MLEKYFLRKMRPGRPDPAYERLLMWVLGVPPPKRIGLIPLLGTHTCLQ